MDTGSKAFLGRGWKFPVSVDEATGRIKTSSYEEDIAEAIKIILLTQKGERVMQPDFGCGIHEYIFDQTDYSTITAVENEITESLILWEPRITDIDVHVDSYDDQKGTLNINIGYTVRATNNPFNLVFPYYINEGTGI